MLTLLTPSKTMDFTTPAPDFVVPTQPVFLPQAQQIRAQLARYDSAQLQTLMHISPALAGQVQAMYQATGTKPAFWTYHGDVFKGVQAATMTADDARFAQRHVLVPSAVYGLVRPFDAIAPYRLEMKAKLPVGDAKNIGDFWGERLARYVASYRQKELLVLSSKEYSQPILRHLPSDIQVVTPVFLDTKPDGTLAQIPIYNKMMRGVMARWVIGTRTDATANLKHFSAHEYWYDAAASTRGSLVFRRTIMTPLRFET